MQWHTFNFQGQCMFLLAEQTLNMLVYSIYWQVLTSGHAMLQRDITACIVPCKFVPSIGWW
jgi:hypothetical protein